MSRDSSYRPTLISRPLMLRALSFLAYRAPSVARVPGVGSASSFVIRDAGLARQIIQYESTRLKKDDSLVLLDRLLRDGLLTTNGSFHAMHRGMIAKMMRPNLIRERGATLESVAHKVLHEERGNKSFDLSRAVHRIALRQTTTVLFDADLGRELEDLALDAIATASAGVEMQLKFGRAISLGYSRIFGTGASADAGLDAVVARLTGATEQSEMLASILQMATATPDAPDGIESDNIRTMLVAGHETTANTVLWALLLGRQSVTRGGAGIFGSHGIAETDDDWYRACIAESLRLYPTGWMVSRVVGDGDPLSFENVTFNPGDRVLISPWVFHRDPTVWEEAARFSPERWLHAEGRFNRGIEPVRRGNYLPFGLGKRICVGEFFAWEAASATLRAVFESGLAFEPPRAVGARAGVTLRPAVRLEGHF